MTRKCTRKSKKTKTTKKYSKLKWMIPRPLDQIKTQKLTQEEISEKISEGKFNCELCDNFYRDEHTLNLHFKTKSHKRRVKEWENPVYTQRDAERAAGLM